MRWIALVFVLMAACVEKPAELRIKGPKDSLESQFDVSGLPAFTRKGQTLQLRASAYDDQERYMGVAEKPKWDTSDRTVATISRTGLLTILSSGKADVILKTEDPPLEARLPIEAIIVGEVRITKPEEPADGSRLKLPMGELMQFEAEVLDDRGNVIPGHEIEWDSTTFAGTIDPRGELEGRAIGYTEVIVEPKNASVSDSLAIEVTDWPKGRRR